MVDIQEFHLRLKPVLGAPSYWLVSAESEAEAIHWAHEQTKHTCYITAVAPDHFKVEPDERYVLI